MTNSEYPELQDAIERTENELKEDLEIVRTCISQGELECASNFLGQAIVRIQTVKKRVNAINKPEWKPDSEQPPKLML